MAAALPFVATAMQVIGAVSSAQYRAAGYDAQAKALDYSAELNRQRAQIAYQQGNQQEEQQRREARQQLARATVSAVQSGTQQGSGADIVGQNAALSELDALNIRYGADLQARGALNEAQQDTYSASVARMNASGAKMAGWLNAGSAALSGYGSYTSNGAKLPRGGS